LSEFPITANCGRFFELVPFIAAAAVVVVVVFIAMLEV
jgi:hypothetical protein